MTRLNRRLFIFMVKKKFLNYKNTKLLKKNSKLWGKNVRILAKGQLNMQH